jgi:hypothetical protein
MAQLNSDIRSSILGNVGTKILFRLSHRDASALASELSPREKTLLERRLVDLKVGQAYLKIKSESPRLLKIAHVPNSKADPETIQLIRQESFFKYARSKAAVEKEIKMRAKESESNDVRSADIDECKGPFTPRRDFKEGLDGW